MKYNRNSVVDRFLKGSQIRNHGLEGSLAMMFAERLQKLLLVNAAFPETRRHVSEQAETRVVHRACMLKGTDDMGCPQRSPVGRLQRDHQEVRRTESGVRNQRDVSRAVEQYVVVAMADISKRVNEGQFQP